MDGPLSFGSHRLRRVDDVIEFEMHGVMNRAEAVILHEHMAAVLDARRRCFLLCDLRDAASVQQDARHYMGEWNRRRAATGVAIYGANFAMRAIATMITSAISMVRSSKLEIVFVRDEVEARAWIDARRAALFPA